MSGFVDDESDLRQTTSHDPSPSSSAHHQSSFARRSFSSRVPHHYHHRHHRPSFSTRDHDLPPLPPPDLSSDAQRDKIIALDRKRRLTASAQDLGRRRTTTGGFTARDDQYPHFRRDSNRLAASPENMAEREVVDLTLSSPPSRPRASSQRNRTSSAGSRGYVVPRWQPDAEVNECPICHRPFGFLFRRHHCRKCGRVVCNDCSPHRITIPRQYIVHPPGSFEEYLLSSGIPTIDLTRSDDDGEATQNTSLALSRAQNAALGGGEKVRLCNPCVPDPQPELQAFLSSTMPPDPFANPPDDTPADVAAFLRSNFPRQPNSLANRSPHPQMPHPGTRVQIDPDEDEYASSSSPEVYSGRARAPYLPASQTRFPPSNPFHSRYHSLDHRQHGPLPPLPLFNSRPRGSSLYDPSHPPHVGQPSFSATMFSRSAHQPTITPSLPQQRPVRPRIREEDICPVCRNLLPPKGPEGDETDRESHIIECISQHDTSASTPVSRTPVSPTPQLASSLPPTQTMTFGASGPTIPIASTSVSAASSTTPPQPMPQLPRMHTTQMLRFTATEKDCTPQHSSGTPTPNGDADTSNIECSICMVEYDVGDRLVRLECWCKFHEECIVEWFGRRAECPVHKIS